MTKHHNKDDLGKPISFDPDFKGPLKNRSCTDIICLFLFIVFIGCWIGIAIYAYSSGDLSTLLVPKDSAGRRCGLDSDVEHKPYLFFFDITKCLSPTVPFTGCPTTQICVDKCPSETFAWTGNQDDFTKLICIDDKHFSDSLEASQWVKDKKCAKWYLPSTSLLNRCISIPDNKTVKSDEISNMKEQLSKIRMWISYVVRNVVGLITENEKWQQIGQNVVDDLINSWWQILIGIGIGVLVCIIYILLMRWTAAVMVWFSLIGVVVLLSAAVYFTAKRYIDLKNDLNRTEEDDNVFQSYLMKEDTWLVLLIIASIVLLIILLMIIFLRKRILLAIALVKEGSKAVSSVTSVLYFPVFPWILQIGVIAFSISVALFLSTTGEPVYKVRGINSTTGCVCRSYKNGDQCLPKQFKDECLNPKSSTLDKMLCPDAICKFITMDNPPLYPYLQAFNVFGFFWGTFFVSAMGEMILAYVFATWYWTWKKSNLPFFAVLSATSKTLRYHIGTLAFGSLIITICRIIRVILEYIDRKLKKYDNELVKAILCCCKCFFWCLEKFLKFINRNAYIMCAIHGKNFCLSAKDAFSLLMRNIIRVFVLDKVTDFLFFLGKVLLTLGVGALAYLFFATDLTGFDNSGLNYNIVPVIIIMICTYVVATIFFSVYSMAVDTLFLCFLEDSERNDGSPEKPYYMSKNLMKIFGKKNKLH